jgi:DNA-binding HxlR family transcriptional regulator
MKPHANVFSAACPSRRVLELLAEKWSLLVLDQLRTGAMRTAEIRRAVGGVSEKMLIQTLRKLERYGLISRQSFDSVPPRVEYRLTRLGASLARMAGAFDRWVERHIGEMLKAETSCNRKAG